MINHSTATVLMASLHKILKKYFKPKRITQHLDIGEFMYTKHYPQSVSIFVQRDLREAKHKTAQSNDFSVFYSFRNGTDSSSSVSTFITQPSVITTLFDINYKKKLFYL